MQKIVPITSDEWKSCNQFNRDIMEEFLDNSTELSPQSLKAYRSNLMIWFNWIRENLENKRQIDIKSREYLRYQNWLVRLEHSSSDIHNKRSAISTLNNYIMLYYEDLYPTFHNFINKGIKQPEKAFVHPKIPPTKAEMAMMIEKLEAKDEWQKIAYLKFTFETGCRRGESRQLLKNIINSEPVVKTKKVKNEDGFEEIKDIKYYKTPEIRCKGKGKTGKLRRLKFSDYAMDALKKWVEMRGEDDCEFMFVVKTPTEVHRVGENTFNQWATNTFAKILGRRFHPHILRESRATSIVVEEGKSIETAQKLLGHNSSETTKIYVINDDDDDDDELFAD
ncbi:MAG: site-specific integrase [Bacteroidaceae bacterium]